MLSVDHIDDQPVDAMLKASELTKMKRGDVVINVTGIGVVRDVQRIKTKPELATLHRAKEGKWNLNLPIHLDVEGEERWKPPTVGCANVVLQLIDFGIGESCMQVDHGTEGQLPGQLKNARTDQPVGNIRF